MNLRDVLVHLDSSPRCRSRLDLAVSIAATDGARLVGLFAEVAPPQQVGVVASWPSADYAAAAAASRELFAEATSVLGAAAVWIDANRGSEMEVTGRVVDFSRLCDLVILGQPPEEGGRTPTDLPENVILSSGRPVLMVPHSGTWKTIGERPLFAWTNGRAAARALADSLALVRADADALIVEGAPRGAPPDEMIAPLVAHLATHGVRALHRVVVIEEVRLMDTLLNQAADHSADLMAVGAFEHAGFPYVGRGSGTRWLLRHMTVPILFSH